MVMNVDVYECNINNVALFGRTFNESYMGKNIVSITEFSSGGSATGRIKILFKDGSVIIHNGHYTINLSKLPIKQTPDTML